MKKDNGSRRTFLKSVLAGSAVAAGIATSGRPAKTTPTGSGNQTDDILYRESEVFRRYYDTLKA